MPKKEFNAQLMGSHDTAVYIGAGIDVLPLLLFRNIRTFIYIDSQPLTEFGSIELHEHFSRPNFTMNFTQTMKKIGYNKVYPRADNLYEYVHHTRMTEVLYFMNNRFPHALDELVHKYIKTASILIGCGYNPDKCIINMMKPGPKVFVGNNHTVYLSPRIMNKPWYWESCIRKWCQIEIMDEEDDDKNGVFKYIHENNGIIESFWRFDVPQDYPYYEPSYVEEPHIVKFSVTQHNSLDNLYTNGGAGSKYSSKPGKF
jgi:hypothetical protein